MNLKLKKEVNIIELYMNDEKQDIDGISDYYMTNGLINT